MEGEDNKTMDPIAEKPEYETDSDVTDIEENEEDVFKKLSKSISNTTTRRLLDNHHELNVHNEEEIRKLTRVVRNEEGDIVDDLHKTTPIMTKYERTRVLGQRCRQLQNGSMPLVELSEYEDELLDDYFIAKLELEQRKLPFVIRRPLPNGSSEYWKVSDLENI
jgi:DNA-directed RNA polymerases I, II, and III subunit RPABC2